MRLYTNEREEYIDQLSVMNHFAFRRVRLCIFAMGVNIHGKRDDVVPIYKAQLHEVYAVFAKEMGYHDELKDGECPAVNIAYPDQGDATWILWPGQEYQALTPNSKVRLSANTKAVEAGLVACRAWLPNRHW